MVLLDLGQTDPRTLAGLTDKKEVYVCFNCETILTEQEHLFCAAGNRSHHTFTNPAGFIFNILTFLHCKSYRETSFPEIENTWFPGYSWIVINCAQCNSLLGWKYTTEKGDPPCFFGLIREQIVLL